MTLSEGESWNFLYFFLLIKSFETTATAVKFNKDEQWQFQTLKLLQIRALSLNFSALPLNVSNLPLFFTVQEEIDIHLNGSFPLQ
jgi:hypothetical protein